VLGRQKFPRTSFACAGNDPTGLVPVVKGVRWLDRVSPTSPVFPASTGGSRRGAIRL